jgi:aminoglycoside phosphotransferase (APT) family kinase protein
MMDAIRSYLNERRGEFWPGRSPLDGAIVAGADRDPGAKVTFIFFDGDGDPSAVAKVARRPSGEAALVAEDAVLRELWAIGSRTVTEYAPRPVALERIGDRLVLVVSVVAGEPMRTRYYAPGHVSDPRAVADDFTIAASWLRRFHDETRRGVVVLDDEGFDRWIGSVFERYRRTIGWSEPEEALFETLRRLAGDLRGCPIPLAAVHGDYAIGNLLVDGSGLSGVIDWEFAGLAEPPFRDVYKFPTSYGLYLDRAQPARRGRIPGHEGRETMGERWSRSGGWANAAGFAHAYFGRGWFPEQVRRFVLEHLDDLGIPRAANALFFPVFLAEQAMALEDPAFRAGYRSLLVAAAEEAPRSWLWQSEVPA